MNNLPPKDDGGVAVASQRHFIPLAKAAFDNTSERRTGRGACRLTKALGYQLELKLS